MVYGNLYRNQSNLLAMKKILFALLISNFCFGQQSITISPTDASHLKIFQKAGTAQLTIQGDGDLPTPPVFFGGTIGHSKIQLQSFVPSQSWGWKSYNSIDFNSAFSIKHTYTPNPSYSPDEFGIYEGTDSIFYYSGNSGKINSVAFSLSSSTSDMLQLHNKSTLANGVENRIFFRTGSNYTGAIKTIGKSETEARMGFFTNAIGNAGQLQERFSILNDGKIGINTTTPQYQMSFKDDLGDKISFYGGNLSNSTNHYGFGIQAAKFQLFTPSDQDDFVFGYGRSLAFTENVRFKGNGNIGIGTSTPNAPLQFASTIANRKIVMYEFANNDHQYVGFGVNGNALRYQVDVPNGSHVFYVANNASSSTELMRVNSTGLGIGINNPAEKLHVAGNIRASGLAGTGTRYVYSDANGTLTTSPQTKYLSIHPSKFKPSTGSDFTKINYTNDLLGFNPTTQGAVFSPIELPHGTQVTALKFYFVDNSTTDDLVFKLMRVNFPTLNGGAYIVSEFQTPLPNNNTYRSGIVNFNSPLIIDNLNNSYFIVIEPRLQSTIGTGTWQVNTLKASSVVITYNE